MRSDSVPFCLAVAVFLASLAQHFARAELTECIDCCASDQQVGFTSFDSNITSQGSLSWSITSTTDKDQLEDHATRYWRGFYLSTPPSLNLSDVTNFSGCGVYFYNVTAALQVPEDFDDYNNYSCDTVMSSACQRDLLQQASDEVQVLLDPETYPDHCGSIATRLAESPIPESCTLARQQPTWGFATGSGMSIPLDRCGSI